MGHSQNGEKKEKGGKNSHFVVGERVGVDLSKSNVALAQHGFMERTTDCLLSLSLSIHGSLLCAKNNIK